MPLGKHKTEAAGSADTSGGKCTYAFSRCAFLADLDDKATRCDDSSEQVCVVCRKVSELLHDTTV